LLSREGNGCLCSLLSCLPLPAELMKDGGDNRGISQAQRMRQLVGQSERVAATLEGLVRIAKEPQDKGPIGKAAYSEVLPKEKNIGAVLLGVIEGYPLL